MSPRLLRTANYSDERRRILGDAVQDARREAGHRWRPSFLRLHSKVTERVLAAVERAEPSVGVNGLEEIGKALGDHFPGLWTKDTPKQILEGAEPPDLTIESATTDPISRLTELPVGSDAWLEVAAEVLDEQDLGEVTRLVIKLRKTAREVERRIAERRESDPLSGTVTRFLQGR